MIQKGQGLSVIKEGSRLAVLLLPSQLLNLDYRFVYVILWLDYFCGRIALQMLYINNNLEELQKQNGILTDLTEFEKHKTQNICWAFFANYW